MSINFEIFSEKKNKLECKKILKTFGKFGFFAAEKIENIFLNVLHKRIKKIIFFLLQSILPDVRWFAHFVFLLLFLLCI